MPKFPANRSVSLGTSSRIGLFGLFLLTALIISSCGSHRSKSFALLDPVKKYQGVDWQNALVVREGHYRIRTNTENQVAHRVGLFMNHALSTYRHVTGLGLDGALEMNIHVYAGRKEYEREVRKLGLPRRMTTGFYSPEPPAAIHLPWVGRGGEHPFMTLTHEGFHQFVHQATLSDPLLNPPERGISLPVLLPLWLNEGLAQFMEGAVLTEDRFDVGRIQPPRLQHLQQTIRSGRCPDLQSLLERRYGEAFSQADYSAAWGLAFALYHGLDGEGRWSTSNLLGLYIRELRRDTSSALRRDGGDGWVALQGQSSWRSLQRLLQLEGADLPAWERGWQQAMLALNPEVPSGGLSLSSP